MRILRLLHALKVKREPHINFDKYLQFSQNFKQAMKFQELYLKMKGMFLFFQFKILENLMFFFYISNKNSKKKLFNKFQSNRLFISLNSH